MIKKGSSIVGFLYNPSSITVYDDCGSPFVLPAKTILEMIHKSKFGLVKRHIHYHLISLKRINVEELFGEACVSFGESGKFHRSENSYPRCGTVPRYDFTHSVKLCKEFLESGYRPCKHCFSEDERLKFIIGMRDAGSTSHKVPTKKLR